MQESCTLVCEVVSLDPLPMVARPRLLCWWFAGQMAPSQQSPAAQERGSTAPGPLLQVITVVLPLAGSE